MKLSARDAKAFLAKPDANTSGVLLYGPDEMRISLQRQKLVAALTGPNAEEEMRLERIAAGDLRKDTALLADAITAQGFFPGARVVLVEGAKDPAAPAIEAALTLWKPGDATLVVTSGQLTPRAALRKLFEGHKTALAAAIYADPPTRDEIERDLKEAGLAQISAEAMGDLLDLGRVLDPGDFRQTLEKLSLYKLGDDAPVSPEDVAACAPQTFEAALDDALDIVAEGRSGEIGPILSRLAGQGVTATALCIGATRHFRRLHAASADPRGPEAGVAGLRPPVPFIRKDRFARQSRSWGTKRLEAALQVLLDTDLALRSPRPLPQMALVERSLVRIAMMNAR